MVNYEVLLNNFGLTKGKREEFINFDTQWGMRKQDKKPYSVITVLRNEANDLLEMKEKEEQNA